MSYYSDLSPLARKQFYEQQKRYRATMKNMCIVIPKDAHATIKAHADKTGLSVTRFMVHSALTMCHMLDSGVIDNVQD